MAVLSRAADLGIAHGIGPDRALIDHEFPCLSQNKP